MTAGSWVTTAYCDVSLQLEVHVSLHQLQSRVAFGHRDHHLQQGLVVALNQVALEVVHEQAVEQLVALDRIEHCLVQVSRVSGEAGLLLAGLEHRHVRWLVEDALQQVVVGLALGLGCLA